MSSRAGSGGAAQSTVKFGSAYSAGTATLFAWRSSGSVLPRVGRRLAVVGDSFTLVLSRAALEARCLLLYFAALSIDRFSNRRPMGFFGDIGEGFLDTSTPCATRDFRQPKALESDRLY